MAPTTIGQNLARFFNFQSQLKNICTLNHLSGCVCGKGKCKEYKKYKHKHHAPSPGFHSTVKKETTSTPPKVGYKTLRKHICDENRDLKDINAQQVDLLISLMAEGHTHVSQIIKLEPQVQELRRENSRVSTLEYRIQGFERASYETRIKSQNREVRDENRELYQRLQQLGLEVQPPKTFPEQELLNQTARAEYLKELIMTIRGDCNKLINKRHIEECVSTTGLYEYNYKVDELETEIENHRTTREVLGAEFEERDMEMELLIKNGIVKELEREIEGLRFEREKLAMDIDLRIGMEIDLHLGLDSTLQK